MQNSSAKRSRKSKPRGSKFRTPLPPDTPTPTKFGKGIKRSDYKQEQAQTNHWKNVSREKERQIKL